MDEIAKLLRTQVLVALINTPLPPNIRKKFIYVLLREYEITLSREELQEVEQFFNPPQLQSSQQGIPSIPSCGFCGEDFPTLEACLKHVLKHLHPEKVR